MALFERKKKSAPVQSELQKDHPSQPATESVIAPITQQIEVGESSEISETAEPVEAIVENPTLSPLDGQFTSSESKPQKLEFLEPQSAAENLLIDSAPESATSTEPEPAIVEHKESPVEQKIQVMMDEPVNGWLNIQSASRNGMPIRVSLTSDGEGIVAFWKRTRSFHAKRWQETGLWCDFITTIPLDFDPIFWKPRFD